MNYQSSNAGGQQCTYANSMYFYFGAFVLVLSFFIVPNVGATAFIARQLTDTPWDNGYPAISGDIVAWQDYRNAGSVASPLFAAAGISTYNLSTNTGGLTIPDARLAGFTFSAPLFQIDRPDLAISGNEIVWTTLPVFPAVGYDIYGFNLQTGVQQAIGTGGNQSSPDISGTRVVWQDPFGSSTPLWDLYLKDLGTGNTTQLTTGFTSKYPSIDGNKIVWGDLRSGTFETHLLDLSTNINHRIDFGLAPDISGNTIVYTKNGHIFAFGLESGQALQITNDSIFEERAFVSGRWVVYSDNRNGHYQIFLYDLTTGLELPLTDGLFDSRFPQVDGNRVVWMGDPSGHWQIFEADLISDQGSILIPPPVPVVSTPEPSGWILLISGLLVMLGYRRMVRTESRPRT